MYFENNTCTGNNQQKSHQWKQTTQSTSCSNLNLLTCTYTCNIKIASLNNSEMHSHIIKHTDESKSNINM